jgi:hypothetical protein
MAGAGRPSTIFYVANSKVVDGGPAPAMTAVRYVALLPDFSVTSRAWHRSETIHAGSLVSWIGHFNRSPIRTA